MRLIEGNQCLGGLSVEAQLGLAEEGLEGVVTLIYPGDKSAAEHEAADCVAPLQRKRAPNPMVPGSGFPGRMTGSIGGPVGRLGQAA